MPSAVFMSVSDLPFRSSTVCEDPCIVPPAIPIRATPSFSETSRKSGAACGNDAPIATVSGTPLTEIEALFGAAGFGVTGSGVVGVGVVTGGVAVGGVVGAVGAVGAVGDVEEREAGADGELAGGVTVGADVLPGTWPDSVSCWRNGSLLWKRLNETSWPSEALAPLELGSVAGAVTAADTG